MNLLAIETTGARASAALADGEGRLTVQRSDETLNHLQHLIPMISDLLSNCGKQIGDVSAIAISEGPGSFTGIRIGMATARALAQVLDVPLVGVPTLRSFAYRTEQEGGCGPGALVCPVFDARRSQVYAGVYAREKSGGCVCLLPDGAYELPAYLDGLRQAALEGRKQFGRAELTLFGDGIPVYGGKIREAAASLGWISQTERISSKDDMISATLRFAPEEHRIQDAASVARLGLELFREGKNERFSNVHPVYLRKAEAQRKLEEAGTRHE